MLFIPLLDFLLFTVWMQLDLNLSSFLCGIHRLFFILLVLSSSVFIGSVFCLSVFFFFYELIFFTSFCDNCKLFCFFPLSLLTVLSHSFPLYILGPTSLPFPYVRLCLSSCYIQLLFTTFHYFSLPLAFLSLAVILNSPLYCFYCLYV